jgi:hypothetical protein
VLDFDEATFVRELERELATFERRALDGIETAVARAGEIVAEEARSSHPYTDRSYLLTESTHGLDPVSTGDKVLGGVISDTEYAEHVERSHPYLAPALERAMPRVEAEAARVIDASLRGARL